MIDWVRVQELREEVGPEDFDEVVELFLEEVEENLTAITSCLAPQDMEEVLHALKGSALSLGFADLAALCQQGETTAAAGTNDGIVPSDIVTLYQTSKLEFLGRVAA